MILLTFPLLLVLPRLVSSQFGSYSVPRERYIVITTGSVINNTLGIADTFVEAKSTLSLSNFGAATNVFPTQDEILFEYEKLV